MARLRSKGRARPGSCATTTCVPLPIMPWGMVHNLNPPRQPPRNATPRSRPTAAWSTSSRSAVALTSSRASERHGDRQPIHTCPRANGTSCRSSRRRRGATSRSSRPPALGPRAHPPPEICRSSGSESRHENPGMASLPPDGPSGRIDCALKLRDVGRPSTPLGTPGRTLRHRPDPCDRSVGVTRGGGTRGLDTGPPSRPSPPRPC